MNNNFQNRLRQFEALPPESSWERITNALDHGEDFARRLSAYETDPPFAVWKKLEASLNQAATPAKVIPFFIRYKHPLRYVAAASVIAALLVTITLTTRQTEAGSLAITKKVPSPKHTQPFPDNSPAANSFVTATGPATSIEKSTGEGNGKNLFASFKRTLAHIRPQVILSPIALTKQFIPRRAVEEPVADFSTQDDFMVYCDNDGTAMRLPKKLFALVNCHDGDGSCKERIRNLRQKLTANVAPSDFTGMLDIVRQLQ